MIEKAINEVLVKNSVEKLDPLMSWEMIKNQVIGQSVRYGIIKSKKKT